MHQFILILVLCIGTNPIFGQSDRGRPVHVRKGDLHVVVGCEGSYSLPSDDAVMLAAENGNIDELTSNLFVELLKMYPTDSARNWARDEQLLWKKARKNHCLKEALRLPKDRRASRDQGCRKWSGTCRLELLLERYDALAE